MKNIKLLSILIVFTLLATVSCEKVLDTEAKDAFAEDLIYSDPDQLVKLVYTAYNSTEGWAINRYDWWGRRFNNEGAAFEARYNFKNTDYYRIIAGWTSSNPSAAFNKKWLDYWDYVRSINEFLDRIDDCKAMKANPEQVNILKAEMKFLRANLYFKLISYFGGVPIMEHALGLKDDFNLVRDSYEDCVDFIVKELDEAAAVLPETRPDKEFGRATKLSALAVKSRTLLYAASKLHDPAFAPSNDPLYIYTKSSKWQDAADAAEAIVDLVGARDLIATPNAKAYQELFLKPNIDILFARPYSSVYFEFGDDATTLWDQTQSPNGYGGWGISTPNLLFTMQFNMADGTGTDGASFNPVKPNDNREMRFYADLLYNGVQFRGRDVQYYLSVNPTAYPNGLDSPKGGGNPLHSSATGYNMRKFQDENVPVAGGISPQRPYIHYRLAEIYLNYAEALYHLSDEVTAREFLNKVSNRALQPDITASGTALLEAIKRERRVELCFEGHNFFDERRWMEVAHLGFAEKGHKWTKAADGTVSFEEYLIQTRPWWDKMYYLPIPNTEVEKAPSILQNYGY